MREVERAAQARQRLEQARRGSCPRRRIGGVVKSAKPDVELAVIGAGFFGIGTAIKHHEAGIRD
jgi:hypothetical protein